MKAITFFDTEIEPHTKKIVDIGAVRSDGSTFHSSSVKDFADFLGNTEFIGGHNILRHDLNYLGEGLHHYGIEHFQTVDTLFLSPLLFPQRPYHRLLKDDKLQTDELNNPVADSIKARDLFFDEVTAFGKLPKTIKHIYHTLLHRQPEFHAFFKFIAFTHPEDRVGVKHSIAEHFHNNLCLHAPLELLINTQPVELAYCLALINCTDRYSITPPWVLRNYPE